MKNQIIWKTSKYVLQNGRLRASEDRSEVSVGSRFFTNIVARFYDINLPKYAFGKILDLGCGKVPLYFAYKDLVTEVTCVDWSNTRHKNEHLDLECNLNEPLPIPDAGFDTLILSDVLEHIREPQILWSEMFRILRPNGVLLLNVPFFYPLHEIPYDYHRYTEFALRHAALEAGFEIILLDAFGGSFEVFTDFVAKHLQFVPIVGAALATILQVGCEYISNSHVGQQLAVKTRKHYPLGYFMILKKVKTRGPTAKGRTGP